MNAKVKIPAELENILSICNPQPLPIVATLMVEHLHKTYDQRLKQLSKRRKRVAKAVIAKVLKLAGDCPGEVRISCGQYLGLHNTSMADELLRGMSRTYPKSAESGLSYLAELNPGKMGPLFFLWHLSNERNSNQNYGKAYNAWLVDHFGPKNDHSPEVPVVNLPSLMGHQYSSSATMLRRSSKVPLLRRNESGEWEFTKDQTSSAAVTIDLCALPEGMDFLQTVDEEAQLADEIKKDVQLLLSQSGKVKDTRSLLRKMPDLMERPDILTLLKVDASPLDERLSRINHMLSGAGLLGLPLEKAQ